MNKKKGGGAKKSSGAATSTAAAGAKGIRQRWSHDAAAATADESMSLYELYKIATLRFKNGLMALVPSSIFEKNIVHEFLDAADYVSDNNIQVDRQLLSDLS